MICRFFPSAVTTWSQGESANLLSHFLWAFWPWDALQLKHHRMMRENRSIGIQIYWSPSWTCNKKKQKNAPPQKHVTPEWMENRINLCLFWDSCNRFHALATATERFDSSVTKSRSFASLADVRKAQCRPLRLHAGSAFKLLTYLTPQKQERNTETKWKLVEMWENKHVPSFYRSSSFLCVCVFVIFFVIKVQSAPVCATPPCHEPFSTVSMYRVPGKTERLLGQN